MFVFLVKISCVFTNFDKQKTNFDLFWRLQAVKFHWILIDHLGFQCCVFTEFFLLTNSDQSIEDIKTTENSSNLTIYFGLCCAFPDFCSWHYWQLSKFPRYISFSVFFSDFAKTKPSRILQVFSSLSKMASLSLDVIAQVVLAAETALPHWALAVKREKISIKYHCLHMMLWFPRISFLIEIQCWHLTILTNCQKFVKFSRRYFSDFDRFRRICTKHNQFICSILTAPKNHKNLW